MYALRQVAEESQLFGRAEVQLLSAKRCPAPRASSMAMVPLPSRSSWSQSPLTSSYHIILKPFNIF